MDSEHQFDKYCKEVYLTLSVNREFFDVFFKGMVANKHSNIYLVPIIGNHYNLLPIYALIFKKRAPDHQALFIEDKQLKL